MEDGSPPPQRERQILGIGLVKVIWKVVSGIISRIVGKEFRLHDILHGLQIYWGTGNASPESNLLQQLTEMRKEIL